jgi:ubiquinone biosynthesis protein
MIGPREALRLFRINLILLRHGLDEVILATHLFRPLRWVRYISPWHWFQRDLPASYPVRVRLALEDLGPIFVKFGQILSTRRDLLPDDLAVELAKLQDRVPPFDGAEARAIIEKAWGCSVDAVLDEFNPIPLASASIAQVHTGRLKDGKEVVVKVLRPGIERTIRGDLGLMYTVAHLAERYWKDGRGCARSMSCANTRRPSTTSWICNARPPTPPCCVATGSTARCSISRRSIGIGPAPA